MFLFALTLCFQLILGNNNNNNNGAGSTTTTGNSTNSTGTGAGISQIDIDNAQNGGLTAASTPTADNSVGLDIEYVLINYHISPVPARARVSVALACVDQEC